MPTTAPQTRPPAETPRPMRPDAWESPNLVSLIARLVLERPSMGHLAAGQAFLDVHVPSLLPDGHRAVLTVSCCFDAAQLLLLGQCQGGQALVLVGSLVAWPSRVFLKVGTVWAVPGAAQDAPPLGLNQVTVLGRLARRWEPVEIKAGDKYIYRAVLPLRPHGSTGELPCLIGGDNVRTAWEQTESDRLLLQGWLTRYEGALTVGVRHLHCVPYYAHV